MSISAGHVNSYFSFLAFCLPDIFKVSTHTSYAPFVGWTAKKKDSGSDAYFYSSSHFIHLLTSSKLMN